MPGQTYITYKNDSINVVKILGYCMNKNGFLVKIKNNKSRVINLSFKNKNSVYINDPEITVDSRLTFCNKYFNIQNPPYLVKHWKKFNFIGFFLGFIFVILYCIFWLNQKIRIVDQNS